MANLLKSFAEMLAAGQNPIANTQVADTGVLDNAYQVLKSVSDTATDVTQAVVDYVPQTTVANNDIVYRTQQTLFFYTDNLGKAAKDILPAGTKVVKLIENTDNTTVLVWFKKQHYIGNILSGKLNATQTKNIITAEGFINDAEHTYYRLTQRLTFEKHNNTAFAQRMLTPLAQSISNFKQLANKDAEQRLKNALQKYNKFYNYSTNKVERVKNVLDAIFTVNDFLIGDSYFSQQILVLPFTRQWIMRYTGTKDETINKVINDKFSGDSGEDVNVGYGGDWDAMLAMLTRLAEIVANNADAQKTPEGKWLLETAKPLLDAGIIQEIIAIHDSTWTYPLGQGFAHDIGIRDIHGPFFTPPLFTVMAHEIGVNEFTNVTYTPGDTHLSDDDVYGTLAEIKNTLKVPTEADKIDNLYQVHSYLSAISLNFIFKLMSVVFLFLTLNLKAQYLYNYINFYGNLDMEKGDTIDLIFYPKLSKYPNSSEEDIQVEWRKTPSEHHSFTFVKCFRIKNNFNFDIYLDRVQTGAGYCMPKGFYTGIIHPGEVQYTVIHLDLVGKESLSRPVGFFFRLCPYTDEEEKLLVVKRFVGKRNF